METAFSGTKLCIFSIIAFYNNFYQNYGLIPKIEDPFSNLFPVREKV